MMSGCRREFAPAFVERSKCREFTGQRSVQCRREFVSRPSLSAVSPGGSSPGPGRNRAGSGLRRVGSTRTRSARGEVGAPQAWAPVRSVGAPSGWPCRLSFSQAPPENRPVRSDSPHASGRRADPRTAAPRRTDRRARADSAYPSGNRGGLYLTRRTGGFHHLLTGNRRSGR